MKKIPGAGAAPIDGTEVGGSAGSPEASGEYNELPDELWALFSRRSFPRRLKIVLPKICTLSGLSREGMLLDVDLPEDFLERLLMPSSAFSHEGRSPDASDRSEDEPDELVWWLRCLSRTDVLFICLLSARMLSGEGGPSIAGSSRSGILAGAWSLAGCFGWGGADDDVSGLVEVLEVLGAPADFDFFAATFFRMAWSTPNREGGGYAHIFMIKKGCATGRQFQPCLLQRIG